MRTSHSQNSTYIKCPKYWDWNYNHKLESDSKGASLYFGSAVDEAIMELLRNNPNYLDCFYDRWKKAYSFGTVTPVFDNDDIVYGYGDFDNDILQSQDITQLNQWADELKIRDKNRLSLKKEESETNPLHLYSAIVRLKKNSYKSPTAEQMKYFNRASWLSMKRKGEILISSFKTEFYPKIKKVVAVQERSEIEDPITKDKITGYIDMVLEIEGYDKPIIFDLKTAARPYTQDQIELTDQLTLYSAMKGSTYNTNLVGYVVLSKNINKINTGICKKCSHIKNSQHKTCNNELNGVRCNGEWEETKVITPEVQVLVESKTPEQVDTLLIDIGNIILAMKNKIVYKNTDKCHNWYGSVCPYYNACHKGDLTGLKKRT